ncbi:zinc finger MYM-type protein 1 [Tanacetum coccineum]|uniref:Zinc finger MYM-type protein 1 n=1 Tax=Tanacetum coccineum TaxID=301880 RepID=A0ABQ5FKB2_9ASTR
MPPKSLRKQNSGHQKWLLKKQKTEQANKAEFGTMHKYIQVEPQVDAHNKNSDDDNVDVDGIDNNNLNVDGVSDDRVDVDNTNVVGVDDTDIHVGDVNVDSDDIDDTNCENMDGDDDSIGEINVDKVDIFDPRNWDSLTSDMIKDLVAGSPKRDSSIVKDWAHLSTRLKEHEVGFEHITNMATWFDMQRRLKKNETIDNVAHEQFEKERHHWMKVLLRIISIVKFLAKHNLAFCGTNEKLHVKSNGNFLGLIEMLEEFDPFIKEHVRQDTTRQGLFDVTHDELKSLDLDIDDVRGQGYDNGSNIKAMDFFGVIQRIYTIFANSSKRWLVLKENVKGLTLKSLSITRWESRVESVKVIRYQLSDIREALLQVAENDNDSKIKMSKKLESHDMLIDVPIKEVEGLISFFEEFKDTGFDKAINVAKDIAIEMDIDPVFRQKRVIRKKRQFDENLVNQDTSFSVEEAFKVQYFLYIVDQALVSLRSRFEQYKEYEKVFGFLFTSRKLNSFDDTTLKSHCSRLEAALRNVEQSDVDAKDLYVEMRSLNNYFPDKNLGPYDMLNFLKEHDFFPNAMIAYKVLLTIPVTVASKERSFSKLKLLKSYLRSTMSQERLNGLALIAIENGLLDSVDYEDLIKNFASKNARRIALFTK